MKLKTTKIMSICLAACGAMTIGGASAQDFVPSGNLWGYAFGDYAFKAHNDTLQRGGGNVQYRGFTGGSTSAGSTAALNTNAGAIFQPSNAQENAFQFRRIYLGYDYNFAPNFTAQVVLANEQNADAKGNNTMYVKYANVKWSNFIKNQDLVFGQYQTCSFATPFNTEPLWSYRSVERTIMDLHNTDGSTDFGVSLQGKLWKQGGADAADSSKPNMLGYYVQVGNNSSAAGNGTNYKKLRYNLYGAFMQHKLVVGFYGDYMVTNEAPNANATSNATMKFYASYRNEWFRLGAEMFMQTNKNSDIYKVANSAGSIAGVANDTVSGTQMGWSVFASGQILKNKLSIFARYDMYNPDTKWNKSNVYTKTYTGGNLTTTSFYTQSFLTAGLDYTPNSRMHLMPNIWYNSYATLATMNGPSGTGTEYSTRTKTDNDLVYRLTFYFLFNQKKNVANNGMQN